MKTKIAAIAAGAAVLTLTGCGVTISIEPPGGKTTSPPAPAPTGQPVSTAGTPSSWMPTTVTGARQLITAIESEGVTCDTGWKIEQGGRTANCESPEIWIAVDLSGTIQQPTKDIYTSVFVDGDGGVFSHQDGNWIVGADDPAAHTLTVAMFRGYS